MTKIKLNKWKIFKYWITSFLLIIIFFTILDIFLRFFPLNEKNDGSIASLRPEKDISPTSSLASPSTEKDESLGSLRSPSPEKDQSSGSLASLRGEGWTLNLLVHFKALVRRRMNLIVHLLAWVRRRMNIFSFIHSLL